MSSRLACKVPGGFIADHGVQGSAELAHGSGEGDFFEFAYFRHVVSGAAFSRLDRYVFETRWRWARRRHSDKDEHWLK